MGTSVLGGDMHPQAHRQGDQGYALAYREHAFTNRYTHTHTHTWQEMPCAMQACLLCPQPPGGYREGEGVRFLSLPIYKPAA